MRTALMMTPILLLAGCNMAGGHNRDQAESGRFEKRNVAVAGAFDSVSLAGSPNVFVAVGGAPSVRVEGDSALLDRLDIAVRGSDLHIGYKKDKGWSWGFSHERKPVSVYVTVPSLKAAAIGGSGDIRIDKVQGDSFAGSIGGSGNIEVAAVRVGEAKFEIAGSGNVRAAGSAERARMSIAGSGDIDAGGLQARTATVEVVGSGSVRARATETADVSVAGSGDVELSGGARCSVHKMGSGNVRCEGGQG